MKVYNLALVGLIPVLAASALARTRPKVADDEGAISQKSRMTAFLITDEGVRVECWEMDDLLESVPSTSRHCDVKGAPRRTKMVVGEGGISGIDISTWPSSATIFPPPSNYASTDFSAQPNLFTVKDGLIFLAVFNITGELDQKDPEEFIFADINGDDWFYFDDKRGYIHDYSSSDTYRGKRTDSPINIRTISGSDTTLINFQYESTPKHTVLHAGGCKFAGLTTAAGRGADKDLDLARLTVQEL